MNNPIEIRTLELKKEYFTNFYKGIEKQIEVINNTISANADLESILIRRNNMTHNNIKEIITIFKENKFPKEQYLELSLQNTVKLVQAHEEYYFTQEYIFQENKINPILRKKQQKDLAQKLQQTIPAFKNFN